MTFNYLNYFQMPSFEEANVLLQISRLIKMPIISNLYLEVLPFV